MYHPFRPLLVAALVGLSAFTACQKAPVEPDSQAETTLVGRWQLTQTSGSISGRTQPADPQQLREIVFGADGQAQVLLNGTPVGTSAYTLSQAAAANTRRIETFINYAGPQLSGHPFIAELSATTLVLSDDYPDGLSVKYERRVAMPTICLLR